MVFLKECRCLLGKERSSRTLDTNGRAHSVPSLDELIVVFARAVFYLTVINTFPSSSPVQDFSTKILIIKSKKLDIPY